MPARWMLGLALAVLACSAPLKAKSLDAQALITRCAALRDAQKAGTALSKACPGVGQALHELGLSPFLPPSWRKTLSPRELAGLGALARRYAGQPSSALPDATALRRLALELKPPPPPPTLWDRVKAWFAHFTAPFQRLIRHWLRSLTGRHRPSDLMYALIYLLVAALVLTVIAVVIIELRAAGLIGADRRSPRPRRRRGPAPTDEPPPSGEPDWPALREQPARLLRALVDALIRSRRLDRHAFLTCRELAVRARFDSDPQREQFLRVAVLAERALYGPPGPVAVSETTLSGVRAIYAELLSGAGRPEPAGS